MNISTVSLTNYFPCLNGQLSNPQIDFMAHLQHHVLNVDGIRFIYLQLVHNLIAALALANVEQPLLVILIPHNISLNFVRCCDDSIGMIAETEE